MTASIADALNDAFENAEKEEVTEETQETEEVTAESEETEVIDTEEAEETEEVAEEEAAETEEEPPLEAPENWAHEDKEVFNQAPKEVQEWALRRHKAMEADYTRKSQEVAEIRKDFGDFYERWTPHKQNLPFNVSPSQYLTNLVNADMMLANPETRNGAFRQLADMYGVDLNQEDDLSDPQIQELKQQVSSLKNQLTQGQQSQQQATVNARINEIQSFGQQVDESGKPKHPHFENVIDDMVMLAQAERFAGREPVLSDLYDKAVWANPSIRAKIQSDQQKASEKKAIEAARAKAAKAKKAAQSVSGTSTNAQPVELGLREMLEKSLN